MSDAESVLLPRRSGLYTKGLNQQFVGGQGAGLEYENSSQRVMNPSRVTCCRTECSLAICIVRNGPITSLQSNRRGQGS